MAVTSHALPSLLLHQWMSSSIIMHSFIVLLLCQCLNSLVYREKISLPSLPLCLSLTLSRSLFLLFHIFKCQLYLCGLPALWSFDVFSSGVSGFLCVCVCEWELITKCSVRCFFSLLIKIKDKRSQSAPPPSRQIHFSLWLCLYSCLSFGLKRSPRVD